LFLNGLLATRASDGDAAVYWADSFSEHGYASFRIDLPGYGDSEGEPPAEWVSFINHGGYAAIAAAKIRELVERFDLSGVIVAGHCAGAVTAIYAAAGGKHCKGLVLLDPYFHHQQVLKSKIRQRVNLWRLQSPVGRILSAIHHHVKEIGIKLRGDAIPENANLPVLRCWKELASSGLPILILKAPSRKTPGTKPKVGEFDYLEYALKLAGRRSHVVVKVAEGANHSFANTLGREAVRLHTVNWLNEFFPLEPDHTPAASMFDSEHQQGDSGHEFQEQILKA
jgi:pimeloyl-ACP methyl ester carboxylesterase